MTQTNLEMAGAARFFSSLLERYGAIPIFSSGIRIAHARPDYPSKIIFWYLGNVQTLIREIHETGFLPVAPASSEAEWRGIPIRLSAILLLIVVWNGFFLLDRFVPVKKSESFALALIPLFLVFLICWGVKTSPKLQNMVLRDGHSINEIKAHLSLTQTVSGILLVIFAIIAFARAFG